MAGPAIIFSRDGTQSAGVLNVNPAGTESALLVRNIPIKSSTSVVVSVNSSASNVTLLASNPLRKGATIYNDSTKNLLVKLGATASSSNFTVKMQSASYYEVPFGYTGIIDGLWDVVNGAALVSELT